MTTLAQTLGWRKLVTIHSQWGFEACCLEAASVKSIVLRVGANGKSQIGNSRRWVQQFVNRAEPLYLCTRLLPLAIIVTHPVWRSLTLH